MKTTKTVKLLAAAGVGALALAGCSSGSSSGGSIEGVSCASGSIKASGSSAQANAITEWVNKYQSACSGATIDYQPNGSGAGVQDFINGQTSFAGSDSALKDGEPAAANTRCATGDAINIPMVGGAITAAYNVSGVDKLVMTPSVLAKIFNGKITKWDDGAIKTINPGVNLPNVTIVSYHRSDSSGTTDNFAKYLIANASSDWPYANGKDWVAKGGQGAKGNDGVASAVKSTANSIGYVELSYAQDQNLSVASIDNGGGAVTPSAETGSAALAAATVTGTGDNLSLKLDFTTKSPDAYPMTLVTYEITCQKGLPADQLTLTKSFLQYASTSAGQGMLAGEGYVPLPADLLTKVQASVNSLS